MAQCEKMQAVTTLCQFQCGVAEVCALLSVVQLKLKLNLLTQRRQPISQSY